MKRGITLIVILGAMILTGCSSAKKRKEIELYNREMVFSIEDTLGDDNGPGTYTYPIDKIYIKGAYDILGVEVNNIDNDSAYYDFVITINNFFKDDGESFGNWDIQMFDIYLNTGDGKYTQTIAGRNLKIKNGWDKVVVIAPEREIKLRSKIYDLNKEVSDDISNYENLTSAVLLPKLTDIDRNKITIRVSKEEIGEWSKIKGMQIFSMGFTNNPSEGYTYNMNVDEFTGQNNFGGGTNHEGNSNVIDILGDNGEMSNYKSEAGIKEFAEVNLIKVN